MSKHQTTATQSNAKTQEALMDADLDSVTGGSLGFAVGTRHDYGEDRIITIGPLAGCTVVIGWTPRGADRHVFSKRKAIDREQKKYAPFLR